MPKQNTKIQIMGVLHSLEYVPATLRKLNQLQQRNAINPNRGLGLEITPGMLKLFEQWYPSPVHLKGYHREQIQEYAREIIECGIRKNPKLKEALLRQETEVTEGFMYGLTYWYEIYGFAKRHNIRVTALDSEAGLIRGGLRLTQKNEIEDWESEAFRKVHEWGHYISVPIRENIFVRRIQQEKPDIVIVGQGHADAVKSKLKKQGFSAQVIFKSQKEKWNREDYTLSDAKIRKFYAQRKKATREWRRQKGILRTKPHPRVA